MHGNCQEEIVLRWSGRRCWRSGWCCISPSPASSASRTAELPRCSFWKKTGMPDLRNGSRDKTRSVTCSSAEAVKVPQRVSGAVCVPGMSGRQREGTRTLARGVLRWPLFLPSAIRPSRSAWRRNVPHAKWWGSSQDTHLPFSALSFSLGISATSRQPKMERTAVPEVTHIVEREGPKLPLRFWKAPTNDGGRRW